MAEAWLYDGRSAVRRSVSLARGNGLLIVETGKGERLEIAPALLNHVESRSDAEIYGRSDMPGWRLQIGKPVDPSIGTLLPTQQVYGRLIDRIGLPKALGIGAAVSAVVLFVGYSAPAWLAPFVPMSVEKRVGDALVGDFGGHFCNGAGGQEALDALAARLSGRPGALNVRVVDVKLINAAALPGGNIVIFRELIQEADGPDQVAGVLAHEIAHVEERHVTEAMIRQLGFSTIVALFGGNTGANVDALLSAGYSRAAEEEADVDALAALQRVNISPIPTADFFARLGKAEARLGRIGQGLQYLSTHPLSLDREKEFRSAAVEGRAYRPALTQDQWDALFSICHNEPSA